ncbi:hypothetical protein PALI_b0025 [Pseudoalteromonas aliena SW19]|uniref:Uncharacterized protein n=1 Tax=Pseudoalteromonas aliena SW19 TaxID=1314866 RepID=A0ABR9E3D3_9GAMM|nr:hypothetical protein [Pseudoalteromonas aliena SW19]
MSAHYRPPKSYRCLANLFWRLSSNLKVNFVAQHSKIN